MTASKTKHRRMRIHGAIVLLALAAPACRSGDRDAPSGTKTASPGATPSLPNTLAAKPPPVPGPALARQHAGAKITFYGDSVGIGSALDKVMAKQFTEDTGIDVKVVPRPKDSTESYAAYQRLFQGQSADVDVMMLDVIWPGTFAPNLLDLKPELGEASTQHLESIVVNSTIGGKLVAMPWFTDFGLLYYRSDLLTKYGYEKPPQTWDELDQVARRIQDGEKTANPNFAGFVWQGKAYEGLTCNALEWMVSHGSGNIVEGGKSTVNSPQAEKALSRAQAWVGTISPAGVVGYDEEDARNVFQAGNAAFMRNWPYAYTACNDDRSPIRGKFGVAPLPHEPGQKSASTGGGWQLGVSQYSKRPGAAIELIRYLTSFEGQKYRALTGGYIPTLTSLQSDADITKALPFMSALREVTLVMRPSSTAGARYNEVSITFFQGVSQVLHGKAPAAVLPQVDQRIQRVLD